MVSVRSGQRVPYSWDTDNAYYEYRCVSRLPPVSFYRFAHARLRLSRLELIGGSGRTAGRYASAARAFISPTAFEQARGGALGAGGGRVGFAGGGLF